METYGSYLRSLRNNTGLTIQKTADLIGVSSQYLSEIERGGRKCLNDEKTAAFVEKLNIPKEQEQRLCQLKEQMLNKVPLPKDLVAFLEANPQVVDELCYRYGLSA